MSDEGKIPLGVALQRFWNRLCMWKAPMFMVMFALVASLFRWDETECEQEYLSLEFQWSWGLYIYVSNIISRQPPECLASLAYCRNARLFEARPMSMSMTQIARILIGWASG